MRAGDIGAGDAPASRSDVTAVELDGELVVFDPLTGALHRLDRIATLVWRHLDGVTSLGALGSDLAAAFAADEATVTGDVVRLAGELGRIGLLDGVEPDEGYRSAVPSGVTLTRPDDLAQPPHT